MLCFKSFDLFQFLSKIELNEDLGGLLVDLKESAIGGYCPDFREGVTGCVDRFASIAM